MERICSFLVQDTKPRSFRTKVELLTLPPKPQQVLTLTCVVRQAIAVDIQLVNPLDDVVVFEVALNGEGCPSKISHDNCIRVRVCNLVYKKLQLSDLTAPNTQFASLSFSHSSGMAHLPLPSKLAF